jgi:hypothetical protein
MPQRNGQNPIRKVNVFGQEGNLRDGTVNAPAKNNAIAGNCPACQTEIPAKPGFRPSHLKCPKCGTPLGKK